MAKRPGITDRAYSQDEFGRESRHLELLVWDNLCIEEDTSVLFCGFGSDGALVERAVQAKAKVTVIETRDEIMRRFVNLGARILRGSTAVIPARNDAFDVAVSHHYLHEIDPFFHSQVMTELARVGKRVVIVEPAPPTDPLGRRIAMLYSRAKRDLGSFEYYQTLEYWKKLLSMVKGEVSTTVLAFTKHPPREYLRDSVELMLDAMKIEAAPQYYLDQLRELADKADSSLLPQARYILVGAAAGQIPQPKPRRREAPPPEPAEEAPVVRLGRPLDLPQGPREYVFPSAANAPVAPEMPPVDGPVPAPPPPDAPFGMPASAPFGMPASAPFGMPAAAPPQPDVHQPQAPSVPFGFPGAAPPFGAPAPAVPSPSQQSPFPTPFAPGPPPAQPPAFGLPQTSGFPGAGGAGMDQPPPGWRWEPPEEDE